MTTHRLSWAVTVPMVLMWGVPLLLLGAWTDAQDLPMTEAGMQVLTRGPIHEAFAVASMSGATAGAVITRTPYDPIAELPPDYRPEGDNVAWIPGYWSWDDDRSDFIWVSGIWRDLPPGRQWIPGYWAPSRAGSQWISGFWGDVAQTEVVYLPAPPEPLEAGPSSPAPEPGTLWTPGSWVWQQTRYAWQPGYWLVQQPDWVWSPAHYTWTPRGHVYVPGYWDHDIVHRGVMFAPVYYAQPVYLRPNYRYSPSTVIDLAVILTSLFVQPRTRHYYYGDYYDRRYEARGFYPWYSERVRRYGDDPIYTHYRSRQLQQDRNWDRHVEEQFRHRREHVDARPAQTLALQVNIVNNRKADTPRDFIIGRSLTEAAQNRTESLRFRPVNVDEREQIETRGRDVRKLEAERAKIETARETPERSTAGRETRRPVRVDLPVSPVASRKSERVTGAKVPPPVPAAPKPMAVERSVRRQMPGAVKVQTKADDPHKKVENSKAIVKASPDRANAGVSSARKVPQESESKSAVSRPTSVVLDRRLDRIKSGRVPTKARVKSQAGEATTVQQAPTHRQVQGRVQRVQPEPDSAGAEVSKQAERPQKAQSKTQQHRTVTKKQAGQMGDPPAGEDDEHKKKSKER